MVASSCLYTLGRQQRPPTPAFITPPSRPRTHPPHPTHTFRPCPLQIDWRVLQEDQRERWLGLVEAAFEELDLDRDGVLSIDEIVSSMRNKLPPAEVRAGGGPCGGGGVVWCWGSE